MLCRKRFKRKQKSRWWKKTDSQCLGRETAGLQRFMDNQDQKEITFVFPYSTWTVVDLTVNFWSALGFFSSVDPNFSTFGEYPFLGPALQPVILDSQSLQKQNYLLKEPTEETEGCIQHSHDMGSLLLRLLLWAGSSLEPALQYDQQLQAGGLIPTRLCCLATEGNCP